MSENKVKQIGLRCDRELLRKINELNEYLAAQSLYVRRSLSETIRSCVENQWLSLASIFKEQRAENERNQQAVTEAANALAATAVKEKKKGKKTVSKTVSKPRARKSRLQPSSSEG